MTSINPSNEGARPDRARPPIDEARLSEKERESAEAEAQAKANDRKKKIFRVVADKAFE